MPAATKLTPQPPQPAVLNNPIIPPAIFTASISNNLNNNNNNIHPLDFDLIFPTLSSLPSSAAPPSTASLDPLLTLLFSPPATLSPFSLESASSYFPLSLQEAVTPSPQLLPPSSLSSSFSSPPSPSTPPSSTVVPSSPFPPPLSPLPTHSDGCSSKTVKESFVAVSPAVSSELVVPSTPSSPALSSSSSSASLNALDSSAWATTTTVFVGLPDEDGDDHEDGGSLFDPTTLWAQLPEDEPPAPSTAAPSCPFPQGSPLGKRKRQEEEDPDFDGFKAELGVISKKYGFENDFGLPEDHHHHHHEAPTPSFPSPDPSEPELFDDDADWGEEEEEEEDDKDTSVEGAWTAPRRPRPGLSLTSEEIEMMINCYTHFIKTSNRKDCCLLVGTILKVGRRQVFEVVKERERLIKLGAPADCIPLPRNQKKRGKPRDRVLSDGHLKSISILLTTRFVAKGQFPKVSEVQTFLQGLPPAGEQIPGFVDRSPSPGPLVCNQKTLKTHLTKLRKDITASQAATKKN